MTVPTYRSDISLKADVVEEVARVVGYDSLPETLPFGQTAPVQIDPEIEFTRAVQNSLTASGLSEIITYPMLDEDELARLNPDSTQLPEQFGLHPKPDLPLVGALNPLRSEWKYMRPTLLTAILRNVSENLKFSPFVAVYETGRVYLPRGVDELPDERRTLAVAIAGTIDPATVYASPREADFFDLSGALSDMLHGIGGSEVSLRQSEHPSLHPGRAAEVVAAEHVIGIAGELHPLVAEKFGIGRDRRVAVAEIDLSWLAEYGAKPFKYRPVVRHQPIEQDYAILVDEDVPGGTVEKALADATRPLATSIQLFDVYRGESIGEGIKSLAFRVTFAAPDRALNESDLDKIRKRVEKQLKQNVGGELRK